jgi:aerobic carbon-monoxide dehydrogenase large subunit
MGKFGIGQPVSRFEDPKLLQGKGRYVDDVTLPHQAQAFVLRSPLAHAVIKSIDVEEARKAPGVLLVLTGDDVAERGLGSPRPMMPQKRPDGSDAFIRPQPLISKDRVRFVGDNLAFIVAETLAQAKDAAELIDVDFDPLPVNVMTEDAVNSSSSPVWDECPDNVAFHREFGDKAAVEAAFTAADHIVKRNLVVNRITTNSMETRGCVAEYDEFDDRYHLRGTLQAPHMIRMILANAIFKQPINKFHVYCDDVGGGFGMKGGCYAEYPLSLWAAEILGRPVKWVSERSDALLADEQARDHRYEAELALDSEGTFLGLRTRNITNIGAYYTSDRATLGAFDSLGGIAGTYKTPALFAEASGVMTNTQSTGPYRGAGRPEAAYIIESMIDAAARELKMDGVEIRRRNTILAEAMPFKTGLTFTYDSGDFLKNLDDCVDMADYGGFAARRESSKANGKLRGVGVSNTIEQAAHKMLEMSEIRFDASGRATLLMGTADQGQGHETVFTQILSNELGLDTDDIRYKDADTDIVAAGTGTFASRSITLGGTAITIAAQKIIEKGTKIVAHMMEADEKDISFDDGIFSIEGTNKSMTIQDVAKTSFMPGKMPPHIEPGLYQTGTSPTGLPNYPNGCHICEVEIDEETGAVEIVRYTVVDDVGTVVNPLLLKGQIQGGIVQGAGQALMEDFSLDADSGQVIAGSFMDYCMPRAANFCSFNIGNNEVPTPTNPLGVKGAGEAGTVGALSAVMSAVNDALEPLGADFIDMPATSNKVWDAIRSARS